MCVLKDKSRQEPPRQTTTEPFRRLYSQRDAKLYRKTFVHFKCNTTVLDFSIMFVWSGVSIPIYFKLCKKRLWAGYFFFIYVFLLLRFFHVLGLVCSPYRGLGQCLAYTFLILRHQVVSIMCEKCLLYSFKKFQAEYKTIYKSIYLLVLKVCYPFAGFHILIQRFDSCLSAPEEGFFQM